MMQWYKYARNELIDECRKAIGVIGWMLENMN